MRPVLWMRRQPPASFPAGGGTALRHDVRSLLWGQVPPPAAVMHRHLRDAVDIAFNGQTPRLSFVTRGTAHADGGVAGADRGTWSN